MLETCYRRRRRSGRSSNASRKNSRPSPRSFCSADLLSATLVRWLRASMPTSANSIPASAPKASARLAAGARRRTQHSQLLCQLPSRRDPRRSRDFSCPRTARAKPSARTLAGHRARSWHRASAGVVARLDTGLYRLPLASCRLLKFSAPPSAARSFAFRPPCWLCSP